MRILRNKQNRKTLAFYRIVFGVLPPYKVRATKQIWMWGCDSNAHTRIGGQRTESTHNGATTTHRHCKSSYPAVQVLLDGTFLVGASRMQCEYGRLVPRLLQAEGDREVFLHVTECVAAEMAAVSGPFAALATAPGLSIIRCRTGGKHGHVADTGAHACLSSLVGPRNEAHFVVATQDDELRRSLRSGVPGTPLILLSKNVLVLEPPPPAARAAQVAAEASKGGAAVGEARPAARGGGGGSGANGPRSLAAGSGCVSVAAARPAGGGGGGSSGPRGAPSVGGVGRGVGAAGAALTDPRPKRKYPKGPSGPNPLSVKRKRPEPSAPQRQQQQQRGGSGVASSSGSTGGGGGGGDGGVSSSATEPSAAVGGDGGLGNAQPHKRRKRHGAVGSSGGDGAAAVVDGGAG